MSGVSSSKSSVRPQSPPRRQRACQPCSKARSRCHFKNNEIGDGCDRCQRMRISCLPPTTKSLRKPRQVKVVEPAQSDDVGPEPKPCLGAPKTMNFGGSLSALSKFGVYSLPSSSSNESRTTGTLAVHANAASQHQDRPLNQSLASPALSHSPADVPPGPGFRLTWSQAEEAVAKFNTCLTAHCPFVILGDDITARQLFRDKPLLFRAILLAGTDLTVAKRREIKRSTNAWIGQHLLVLDEGDVGILQGLIVYIAWSTPDSCSDSRVTQFLYIAVGLAHKLGMTRPDCSADGVTAKQARTNEERRTFLACYYFLSVYTHEISYPVYFEVSADLVGSNSIQFGRINPLASPAVSECVDSLDNATEVLSDFLVAKMVRMRQYIEQIPAIYHGFEDANGPRKSCEEISIELQAMKRELDDFMSDISFKHPKLVLLWSCHHLAILHLYMPMTYISSKSEEVSKIQLESMTYCLQAGRTFASMLQTLGPEGLLSAPFTTLNDLITLLIALCRLLLVDIKDWDLKAARDSIDMTVFFEALISKLTAAGKIREERIMATARLNPSCYIPDGPDAPEKDPVYVLSKRIEMIRDWYNCQISSDGDSMSDAPASPRENARTTFGPSQPRWDQKYFFQSVLQIT
ncbi:hypothetical protein F5Y18DRAFT_150196 [Xylariaceae sp. FL1019]|nr:hypothetical protein F5Y18DRAFT_150196 [Xylariaceae sp. FL1019]